LGLLVVFCLCLLQFHVETLDYFFDVVVLHFEVAFGLCYSVLEELEFGVERLADTEDIVAALVGFLAD
jgi:hypothetical protein